MCIVFKRNFVAASTDDELPVVKYYWTLGFTDEKIVEHALLVVY